MFYLDNKVVRMNDLLESVALINYHMQPYMAKSEKSQKKLEGIMGDSYYWLEVVHNADKLAK